MNTETRTQTGFALSSLDAHEVVKPKKQRHYDVIQNAMEKLLIPVTSQQIASSMHCELDRWEVARRLPEMESLGIVKVVGRKANIKNRPLLWELTA